VVYRPKTEIALELYDRAQANGLKFDWLTFDEWYGGKPPFLRALDDRGQRFLGEIGKNIVGWIDPPRITQRSYRRGRRGRSRKTPRIVAGSRKAQTVEQLAESHPSLCVTSQKPREIGLYLEGGFGVSCWVWMDPSQPELRASRYRPRNGRRW
jgi:hypothetical protein